MSQHKTNKKKELLSDVVVIGGGLVGVLSAIEIALEGKTVLICEKYAPISQASALNAGGVRRIGRAREEMPLAMAAAKIWQKPRDTSIAGSFIPSGHLILAETEAEAAKLTELTRHVHEGGLGSARLMTATQITNHVPGLQTDSIVLGLYTAHDGYAEPAGVKASVLRAAAEAGVRFLDETDISEISASEECCQIDTDRFKIRCGSIVNAAGHGGAKIAAMVGDTFEIETRAPIALETTPTHLVLGPVIQTMGRKLTLKQLQDGRFLIGGGHRGIPYPEEGRAESIAHEAAQNLATARSLLSTLDEVSVARSWAGLEAYSSDGLPIIGRSANHPSVIHAFAFSGHGFQISPAVALVVADLVARRPPRTDISGLQASRFFDQTAGAEPTLLGSGT